MKKYLLSFLLIAALVASIIVPTLGDGETEDNFKGDASLYILHADGSKYDGQSKELNSFLENGYLYIQTKVDIESTSRVSGIETLELQATEGNLDNIESIEYTEKGSEWADAYGFVVNTNHNFTDKFSIERNYRIKITGPVSFCMKYKVFTPEGIDDYASFPRYVFITESQGGQLDSLTYFEKPTTAPTTTTEAPTTTTEKQSTTVAPTTTLETTPDFTTYTAPAPTTVDPSSDATTVAPTKGQKTKAPGKAKIKKVWKKKKSAKKLKVKLNKVKNAKGYQVCVYKNKKNAKKHIKAIVTKNTTKVKYTIKSKKLKNKKKLFVGARAYNVSSNGTKVFGPWAKIKKVKIK